MTERRKHYLINKPLQFKYMAFIFLMLTFVSGAMMVGLYFGIWGGVLDAFSNEKIQQDLLTASRLVEYEKARVSTLENQDVMPLSFFKQSEKLSRHQQQIFQNILKETNRKLIFKFFLLLTLIAWASIYLTHKIAGPLYRFHVTLLEIAKGNLALRIRLRQGDEAISIAHQFNRTIEYLDHLLCRFKNILKEYKSDPRQAADRIEEELSKIKTSVDL